MHTTDRIALLPSPNSREQAVEQKRDERPEGLFCAENTVVRKVQLMRPTCASHVAALMVGGFWCSPGLSPETGQSRSGSAAVRPP